MRIEINNCSSPGASFTDNTNNVILSCYEWVVENNGVVKPFIEFRREVSKAKNFNDNNARNIYPLLQNFGFISYQKGANLHYDRFFTNTGKAYAKMLQTERIIAHSSYGENEKKQAIKKMQYARETLIYQGLINLLFRECNYKKELLEFLRFLIKFRKISKIEFSYLLFSLAQALDPDNVERTIGQYRAGKLTIEVVVAVRNDIELREKSGDKKRKEDLSFLTSYSYFCGLLEQAGLIVKLDSSYYTIASGAEEKITKLLRGE